VLGRLVARVELGVAKPSTYRLGLQAVRYIFSNERDEYAVEDGLSD
jgi:hypothetical protein